MTEEDEVLRRKAKDELGWDPRIPARSIRIGASHGLVEISGHVGDYAAKWRAEHVLERVRGVCRVVNDIQVVPSVRKSDGQIALIAIRDLLALATIKGPAVAVRAAHASPVRPRRRAREDVSAS